MSDMIHPGAWIAWLLASLVALSATRNPLYLLLALLGIGGVGVTLRPRSKAPPLPVSPLRLGLLMVVLSALFNALTSHFGETVLFRLPAGWPLIGGPITLEALVFGALNGLVLAGFLAAFAVLNMALPTHALVRLLPAAFYPAAVVITIAVAFVPTTLQQFHQVREAQLVRGHRVRGLRDWLPLFMPLFVGGLERAFQLAEAMTARGFGGESVRPDGSTGRARIPPWLVRLLLLLGLAAILTGLLSRLLWHLETVGMGFMVAGGAVVVAALWLAGRRVKRTTYRPQPWRARDGLVVAGAAVVLAAYLGPLPALYQAALSYSPYPLLSRPSFAPLLGLATLGLLAPALWLMRQPLPSATPG